jgi:isopenicillin N synthase-like dioxygenase
MLQRNQLDTLVLFGMQNMIFAPFLAVINMILISVVILLGGCQVLTNDKYKAVQHRVRTADPSLPRYSAPFFFNPSYAADIEPMDVCKVGRPAMFRPVNWGKFRAQRFAGDYKDVGEEVQIEHFRI